FAGPFPARTIATIIGAPPQDAAALQEWSSLVQQQFDIRALAEKPERIERAVGELYDYLADLLEKRRSELADDLISTLLEVEAEGERLSGPECVNLVLNVLAGGIDTTTAQLAHALRLFAAHPEQWELLGQRPELVPGAVDEVLRFEPITPFTARLCTEQIEHRGVIFPAGTIVAICAERANRETDAGEVFDITAGRAGERVLTFGAGAHFCLGQNLARAELEEALGFLAPRMPGLRHDGDERLGGVEGIYGIEWLPLAWSPARTPHCGPGDAGGRPLRRFGVGLEVAVPVARTAVVIAVMIAAVVLRNGVGALRRRRRRRGRRCGGRRDRYR